MGGYNLPPGVSESDLPGWHDIDVETTVDCENCGEVEMFVTVDSRYGEYEEYCPNCEALVTGQLATEY